MTRNGLNLMLALASACLAAAGVFAYSQLCSAHDEFLAARSASLEASHLSQQITLLQGHETAASTRSVAPDIKFTLAAALAEAGIVESQIEQITPEPSRRFGETTYRETSTHIRLRQVSMIQLVTFLRSVERDECVRGASVRLLAPRDEAGTAWTAELTLSQLAYSSVASAAH